MGESPNLPVVHESEELSTIEKLRSQLARSDGYLSPSNATVPVEASDVGASIEANPRASSLDYETAETVVEVFEGHTYLADGRVGPTAELGIDSGNFIEDVTDWA